MQEDNQPQGTEPQLAATEEQPVSAETTPEAMPTSNEEATEEKQGSEPKQEDGLELPEGASERTREQFNKLKSQLAEERSKNQPKPETSRKPKGASVFDEIRPRYQGQDLNQVASAQNYQNLNQQQVNSVVQQYIDEEGNVDVNGLNQALVDANRQASMAAHEARMAREQISRYEETQQVKEAHTAYPQLDPNNEQFDPHFYKLVRNEMMANFVNGQDKPFVEVAQEISNYYKGSLSPEKIREEAINDYKQVQAARQQGPIEDGAGQERSPQSDWEALRQRARMGDQAAQDEMIRRATEE
jgi:hypothetical protein